ncbi:hypothetical protein Tco_0004216 [Tanacetum coccineum]
MRDENHIRTLRDYSKPSHEGYRNTIELPVGNNVVPLRSNTTWLVQNGCSFHGLRSADPNQHIKDFLKLVDSLDLDGENKERTRLQDLALYGNKSWNNPRDFPKPVKAIALPQDVPSTSDRRLIELKNQYCMEDPEQAFVKYASSRTDEAGGLVSNFMASQDARLTKFEADFKQQQGALPSDTVKNLKLSTSLVLSARSYLNMDPQCSNHIHGSINAVTIHSKKQSDSYDEKAKENKEEEKDGPKNIHVNPFTPVDPSVAFITEKVLKFNSFFESLGLVPQSSDTKVVCTKGEDEEVLFSELIRKNDDSSKGEPKEEGSTTTEGSQEKKKKEIDVELCRKANLLEDKQIPSVGVFDEVFSTWMAFGGNTHDLGSFGEETNEITDLHQILEEVLLTERGDGVAGIKECCRDPSSDGVRDLVTASGLMHADVLPETENCLAHDNFTNELLKLENDRLMELIISQDLVHTVVNSVASINDYKYFHTLSPRIKNNREAHVDYLNVTQEHTATLWDIVEQARDLKPLDNALDYAFAVTPLNRTKKVRFADQCDTSKDKTYKQVKPQEKQATNNSMLPSTGVSCSTEASRSKPRSNTKKNRISQTSSSNKKENKVEDHHRIE